jgi:hypothetical protein
LAEVEKTENAGEEIDAFFSRHSDFQDRRSLAIAADGL